MLVLTRKAGESIVIGSQVRITVLEMQGRQIRLGIDAPPEIPVHRGEVYERIKEENKPGRHGWQGRAQGFEHCLERGGEVRRILALGETRSQRLELSSHCGGQPHGFPCSGIGTTSTSVFGQILS